MSQETMEDSNSSGEEEEEIRSSSEEGGGLREWDVDLNPAHEFIRYSRGLDMEAVKEFLRNEPDLPDCIQFLNGFACQVISNQSSGMAIRVLVVSEDENKLKWEIWHKGKFIETLSGFTIQEREEEVNDWSEKPKRKKKPKEFDVPKEWCKSLERNVVKYVTYRPDVKGGIQVSNGIKFLNTFTGFPFHDLFRPTKEEWEEDWTFPEEKRIVELIEYHLFEVISRKNKRIYRFIKTWMRMVRQHPAFRPECYIVCIGEEGSGKSLFWQRFLKIFGDNGVYAMNPKSLTAKFTADHLDNVVLVACDEADFNDKAFGPTLKNLVTSEKRHFEKKGQQAKQVKNYMNGIFTTNSRNCLPISKMGKNRRYLAVEVLDTMVDNEKYFDELADTLESQRGLEVFDWWLRKKKVAAKRMKPPVTEEINNMKLGALNVFQNWWLGVLEKGEHLIVHPGMESDGGWLLFPVNLETLYQTFVALTRDKMTKGNFIVKLKRVLPLEGTQIEITNTQEARFPPLETCKSFLYRKLGLINENGKRCIELNERDTRKKKLRQTQLNFNKD